MVGFLIGWIKRKIVRLVFSVIILVLGALLGMYYSEYGRIPQTGEQLAEFKDFSLAKLRLAKARAQEEWAKIDWDQVSAESKAILSKAKDGFGDFQKKINEIAAQRAARAAAEKAHRNEAGADAGATGGQAAAGGTAAQLAPVDPAQERYEDALLKFGEAKGFYLKSFPGQADHKANLKRCREALEQSQDLLQEAMRLDPQHRDANELMQAVQEMIYDCVKRS